MFNKTFIMAMSLVWMILSFVAMVYIEGDKEAGRTAVIIFNIWFAAWMVKS